MGTTAWAGRNAFPTGWWDQGLFRWRGMGIEGLEPLAACLFASLTLYSPREPPTFVWVTFLACNLYIFCILRLYFAGYQNKNYVAEQYEWWEGEEVWCYPGLWAWEILLQGAQPICHALRIPLFAYVCCLLVPPLSFIFQLFHFLFFYTTQKPRPCLMCKKQPSAATFLHGLFARSRRVAESQMRRPGDHQTVRGTFSSCGSNCACWSCRMPQKLEWEWKCETWKAAQRLCSRSSSSRPPLCTPLCPRWPRNCNSPNDDSPWKTFDSARWRISKRCWTWNCAVCLSALN